MADLDLANRDPNNINDHLQVRFDEVIAEPDGAHSVDCCWKCSYGVFKCSKGCLYKFFTCLCACPLAFCWGLNFAWITFTHVWYVTPCFRVFTINCGCAQRFFGTCLQCCLGPICEVYGLIFSQIVVKKI